jgi:hypothetical protein
LICQGYLPSLAIKPGRLGKILSSLLLLCLFCAGNSSGQPADRTIGTQADRLAEALLGLGMPALQSSFYACIVQIGVAAGGGWHAFGTLPVTAAKGGFV